MGTYSTSETNRFSLRDLQQLFLKVGVTRLIWKPLSANDNSKNQPYLGGDFSALNIIPTGPLTLSDSASNKKSTKAGSKVIKAALDLCWISATGQMFEAPSAQLILYPQYPEVRLSGFLKGSKVSLSEWMQPQKQGRAEGRHLLLGVTASGKIFAYLAPPNTCLATELEALPRKPVTSVFFEVPLDESSNKVELIEALMRVHQKGWLPSIRLKRASNGHVEAVPYQAANGGGYTLEAQLGIFPNGVSAPDYRGWELKQYGVKDCSKSATTAKAVTLMTPEPDGGFYKESGVNNFVRKFGYKDKLGRENRMNFGGTHYVGTENPSTSLTMQLAGLNHNQLGFSADGAIELVNSTGDIAASWSYTKLLEHWKRKHSNAAYIPAISQATTPKQYLFCSPVYLGEGTDFSMYLQAMEQGIVYYDPGIKLVTDASGKETSKRRSQFRVRFKDVKTLYKNWEVAQLVPPT